MNGCENQFMKTATYLVLNPVWILLKDFLNVFKVFVACNPKEKSLYHHFKKLDWDFLELHISFSKLKHNANFSVWHSHNHKN